MSRTPAAVRKPPTAEMESIIADIQNERTEASIALSTQTRAISYGVLAVVWLLLSGTQSALTTRFTNFTTDLLWIGMLCVVALLLDFFQYGFSFWESDKALKSSLKASTLDQVGWNEADWKRRVLSTFFGAKIVTTLGAAAWLLLTMYLGLSEAPVTN